MPEDLADDWDASPRRETRRGSRAALVRALQRWTPHAIGPALVAASAMLVAGQLFSAYRTVWPSEVPGQFQLTTDSLSAKIAYLIAAPFNLPLISASLPVLVLAGLTRLRPGSRLSVGPRLRLAALVTALVNALVGVVLFVAVTVWALVTRGETSSPADGSAQVSFDPVVAFLTRGGDGLATAALAGIAGWLLWTTSADVPPAALEAPRVAGDEAATSPRLPVEDAGAVPLLAQPAYRDPSARPASPAPFVTRGGAEPPLPPPDPALFRRPSARADPGLEPTPDDVDPASADPATLFRRPVR